MDCKYYKCQKCGFVYQVPAYWSGYDEDGTIEMPHVNLETKEMCEVLALHLMEE